MSTSPLVELCRPPDNPLDLEILTSIADLLESAAADPECRVVLLRSQGKHFSSGASLRRKQEAVAGSDSTGSGQKMGDGRIYVQAQRIFAAPVVTVASVQGAAVGGGLGLALAADFRIGSPETRLCANFVQLGFFPGFALTTTLGWVAGRQYAYELLCTGRRVRGDEAARMGLLDRLCPLEDLDEEAVQFARQIATGAPLSLDAIRAEIRRDKFAEAAPAIERETREQARLRETHDFREGMAAVMERRPARFVGR